MRIVSFVLLMGWFFFQLLIGTIWQKSLNTAGKSSQKSVNSPSVPDCWKLTKLFLRKVAEFYWRLYGWGGGGGGGGGDNFVSPTHHTNVCKVSRLCGATSSLARFARITFKLGKFTVIKALSPAVSMVRSMDIRFAYWKKKQKNTVKSNSC